MAGRVRVYERVRGDAGDRCLVVEDGVPCSGYARVRGLCNKHYLRSHDDPRLQAIARAPLLPSERKREIRLKEEPEPGVCRVIDSGEPCPVPAERRGLCLRHYHVVHQRGVLEEFALPRPGPDRFTRRKRRQEGMCLVREDGRDCQRPGTKRGLCSQHYARFLERHPEILQRIALPARGSSVLTLRERPPAGRCRILENGHGCPGRAEARGLCLHHYSMLSARKNGELFERLALPPRQKRERVFTRRPDAGADPRLCTVIENGVPCSAPPVHRGVCRVHRRLLGHHRQYSREDFYLPEPEVVLRRKTPAEAGDGLCLVIADDIPCRERPYARGLCRPHLRMAYGRGTVDELGLPPRTRVAAPGAKFGARNELPHYYLDKNVLFDHADHVVFAAAGQSASVTLVEAVRAGRIRATVSLDALKSTYGHVRYRLARPVEEGGRGLSEDDAEARARAYLHETFLSGGAIRIEPAAPEDLAAAARDESALSLEDALEHQVWLRARMGRAAPTLFVTRDRDFEQGVHPARVLDLPAASGWPLATPTDRPE